MKIFAYDPIMKRIDLKVKFPKGYVEPRHSHKSWHSILVTKGRMCVAGKNLRPGDYVFGWDHPHGPYEYPDGCEVNVVFMGEGTQHAWDKDKFLHHRTLWKAESAAGKKAVARGEEARKHEREKKAAKKLTPTRKKIAKKNPRPSGEGEARGGKKVSQRRSKTMSPELYIYLDGEISEESRANPYFQQGIPGGDDVYGITSLCTSAISMV